MGKQKSDILLLKIDGELKDSDTDYPGESTVEEINSQSGEIIDVESYCCVPLAAHTVTELFTDVQ